MSKLYIRSLDVFQTSRLLVESKLQKYKTNNNKISLDEFIDSSFAIRDYLSDNAKEVLKDNHIKIVFNPFNFKSGLYMPKSIEDHQTLYFPHFTPTEEDKRIFNFSIGTILSNFNPDNPTDLLTIPDEYSDVLSFLLQYLYLKEENKEDTFSIKHLNILKRYAKRYIKTYDSYNRDLLKRNDVDCDFINDKIQLYNDEQEKKFLIATLNLLIPFSSLDGTLQIIDKIQDKNELRKLIELLVNNEYRNRQKILYDRGIESEGYKRLQKEIEKYIK